METSGYMQLKLTILRLWCLRILAILIENLEENVTWADPLKAHAHFLTASPNHSLLPPDPQLGSNLSTL